MKKLLLILTVCGLIGGVSFAKWKAAQPLIVNGDFEAQWVPEGVMILTNRITGWKVTGQVGLWREGTNTLVAIPFGASIKQDFWTVRGDAYFLSFRVAAFDGSAWIPWEFKREPQKWSKWRNGLTLTVENAKGTVYVDAFKAQPISESSLKRGNLIGHEQWNYMVGDGLPIRSHANRWHEVDRQLN